ncbi:hypothetical protein B0O99DRAFT_633629 [Bisporella sp. PMI_857]|nr:hypothetical protein B0O99DRAFT_633629 [Bisporella sp. PMI_857]
MSASMRIVRVPSQQVDDYPENYNSSFHKEQDAPGLTAPTEEPTRFSPWLDLIARSRGIDRDQIQRVALTQRQGQLLFAASSSTVHTHVLNRTYVEELADEILPSFSHLVFPPSGLFLRLDACSPKDGKNGTQPLRNVDDVVLRITSSFRARNAIDGALKRTEKSGQDEGINFYFLPFNDKMSTAHEYRVFCAPPNGSITAVSQYKWHTRSVLQGRFSDREIDAILVDILKEIRRVHGEILEEIDASKMGTLLLTQGFSFDVMYDEDAQKGYLIELNTFGARSGCGSCLYHWIRDMDTLYGTEDDVEFRISVDSE